MLLRGIVWSFLFAVIRVSADLMRLQPLKGYNAFGHVFETGKRFAGGSVTAFTVFGDPAKTVQKQQLLRFGVTARKRTRPAVLRNRIKRLLRESLRQIAHDYDRAGEVLPFQEIVLIWNAVPRKPSLLRLHAVLPAVRDVVDRATRYYRKEYSDGNAL